MFKLAKSSAIKARTQTINQPESRAVGADPQLRETLSGLSNPLLIRRCTQPEVDTPCDITNVAASTLQLLARHTLALINEIRELEQQITAAVTSHAPRLLTRCGIGPDNAAVLLIATGDNPESTAIGTTTTPCNVFIESVADHRDRRQSSMPLAIGSYSTLTSLADEPDMLNLAWTLDERELLSTDVLALVTEELSAEIAEELPWITSYLVTDPYGETAHGPSVAKFFSQPDWSVSVTCGAGVGPLLHGLSSLAGNQPVHLVTDVYPDMPFWVEQSGNQCVSLGTAELAGDPTAAHARAAAERSCWCWSL